MGVGSVWLGMGVHDHFEDRIEPAPTSMYRDWLLGHLSNGGEITHYYNYPTGRWDWKQLTRDTEIPTAHGANAYRVIVPGGKTVKGKPGGHNYVYYMDGFRVDSGAFDTVPLFNDIASEIISAFPRQIAHSDVNGLSVQYQAVCKDCSWTGDIESSQNAANMNGENHEHNAEHSTTLQYPLVHEEADMSAAPRGVPMSEAPIQKQSLHVFDTRP